MVEVSRNIAGRKPA